MLYGASSFNQKLDFDTSKVTSMMYVEGPPPPPPPVPPRTAYYNNDDTTPLTADEPSPVRWPSTPSAGHGGACARVERWHALAARRVEVVAAPPRIDRA